MKKIKTKFVGKRRESLVELDDFEDAVRRALAMKVTTIKEPHPSENGNWEFWIRDPEGYTVVLTSPLP